MMDVLRGNLPQGQMGATQAPDQHGSQRGNPFAQRLAPYMQSLMGFRGANPQFATMNRDERRNALVGMFGSHDGMMNALRSGQFGQQQPGQQHLPTQPNAPIPVQQGVAQPHPGAVSQMAPPNMVGTSYGMSQPYAY
jgi:hypothetical protein